MNLQLVTEQFPVSPGSINLNAASAGPIPWRTVHALTAFNTKRAMPWTITADEQLGALAQSRVLLARLIGASPEEIALTPNTSWGLNVAARVLPIEPGKVILSHDAEFPSNVYPWMAAERTRGIRYERVPLQNGLPDHDALIARIAQGDVGLVTVSWVSFLSGDRADLRRIGEACKQYDAWFVVDAMQGVGAIPLDVTECHIDMLACGAGKWLCSPWGAAFLYVRRALIEALEPGTGGWLSVRYGEDFTRMLDYDATYVGDARKFEVATLAYQDFVGMNVSLELLFEIGMDVIHRHVHALTTQLIAGIDAISGLTLVTAKAPERRAGIVSCRMTDADGVAQRLAVAGIVCSVRAGGILRLAPHFYNTSADIGRTLEVLDD